MTAEIAPALKELQAQKNVILVDDLARSPQAFLLAAAASIEAKSVTEMVNIARGVVCAALSEQRAKELRLPPMLSRKQSPHVDFTVSVEARQGVSTGISAADRAVTLRTLANSTDSKLDLVTPGHIFPLRAKIGGVLVRSGIAEAAVDLLTLAGLAPVAALCQCLDSSGEILSRAGITALEQETGLRKIEISQLIRTRLRTESIVEKIACAKLPTDFAGDFKACCFLSRLDGIEHLALVKGDITQNSTEPVLVRVQAESKFSDLLSLHKQTGLERIRRAMKKIEERGRGIFVYVRHPQKSGLAEELEAATGEKTPLPTGAELRETGIGAQILAELGVRRIELLTNSSRDIPGISAFHLEVVSRIPF